MWGRGWQGSQAITQSQFIFLPPAEACSCAAASHWFLPDPTGGQFTQPVYLSHCQDFQAATMGCLRQSLSFPYLSGSPTLSTLLGPGHPH